MGGRKSVLKISSNNDSKNANFLQLHFFFLLSIFYQQTASILDTLRRDIVKGM